MSWPINGQSVFRCPNREGMVNTSGASHRTRTGLQWPHALQKRLALKRWTQGLWYNRLVHGNTSHFSDGNKNYHLLILISDNIQATQQVMGTVCHK